MTRHLTSLIIEDWQYYGDYMTFAKLVDGKAGKEKRLSVILSSTAKQITVLGTEEQLKEYSERLKKVPIGHKFIYDNEKV